MKLDRELQLQMLRDLEELFPNQGNTASMAANNPAVMPNLIYLAEHGLIAGQQVTTSTSGTVILAAKITAAGLDFLADDGGLSAILGVVTIKLHSETIHALLDAKIEASNLPPAKKSWLRETIKSASADALKDLTKKLVAKGLEHGPEAIQLIETTLSQWTP